MQKMSSHVGMTMENKMEKYPETPVEVLLTSLMDYRHVIEETSKQYPEDKDVAEMVQQYNKAFAEFEKTVKGGKWKGMNDDVQNIISMFEAVSEDTLACLLSGMGSYIDIVGQAVSGNEKADQQMLDFYESLVNLFNDVAAIFSALDESYTYRDLLSDMVSDGMARFPEHKVLFDSFQEQAAAVNADEKDVKFMEKFYDGMNPVEKNYFLEDFMPAFISGTEASLEKLEQSGEKAENMSRMMNSVVAAKKTNRKLLIKASK